MCNSSSQYLICSMKNNVVLTNMTIIHFFMYITFAYLSLCVYLIAVLYALFTLFYASRSSFEILE